MESSKKKRNSVLPIIVSVGIATSMGVVANSTPEVAYARSNAATSASTAAKYADRSGSEDNKNQVITFKDPVLKSKLLAVMKEKNIIASGATDITIANAEKLKEANLRNWSVDSTDGSNTIHDLTGIEHFKKLVYLNFDGNNVSDLTPLENLFLKALDFSKNKVSDLTPLGTLDSLEDLYFSDNKISKLDTLQYLHSLATLNFSGNQVSDLTPLENLDSLTKLVFDDNKVSDLTPLENLKRLENLYFSDNQVSDLTPLENLTKLTELSFIGNQVSDLIPLSGLTNLTDLLFNDNKISDLTPLSDLTSLKRLKIGNQTISIDSDDKETTLPVSDVTFTIQGEEGNSIGSITNDVFTLSKELPYSGTISIDFKRNNIKIGDVTASYTGTITLNLNVPKIDNGVTTWVIKAKMKYEADPNLDYQQKQQVTAAKDGTRTTYEDGRNTVEVPAKDGLTKVGNVEVTHDGNKTITTTYTVDPDTGTLSNPKKHTSMPIGTLTGSTKTEILHGVMKYEADSSLPYNTQKKISDPVDGKKATTSVINGDPKVETTPAKNGLTKVGNKQVTREGDKTITTTYTVDPNTGELSNPKKHTSMPIGTLTGSTKTEILKGEMKYEADSSLDYNTQKKISDPVDGKKITTSVINGEPKVETTEPVNGLTKVGNVEVTHEGDKTITTTYDVDSTTGKLSNPKKHTSMPASVIQAAPQPPAPKPPTPQPPTPTPQPPDPNPVNPVVPPTPVPPAPEPPAPEPEPVPVPTPNPVNPVTPGQGEAVEPGQGGSGTSGSGTPGSDTNPGGVNPNVNPGVNPWFNHGSTGGSTTGSNGEGTNSQPTDLNNFGNDFNTGGTNYGTGTSTEGSTGTENSVGTEGIGSKNSPSAQRKNGQTHKTHAKNGANNNANANAKENAKANSKANANANANANSKANSNSKSSESTNNSNKTAESSKSSASNRFVAIMSAVGVFIIAVLAAFVAFFAKKHRDNSRRDNK